MVLALSCDPCGSARGVVFPIDGFVVIPVLTTESVHVLYMSTKQDSWYGSFNFSIFDISEKNGGALDENALGAQTLVEAARILGTHSPRNM